VPYNSYDPSQTPAKLQDARRLNALKALTLMDTPTEAMFDRLTRLATRLIGAPVSLVSLVDGERQWFKSMVGLPQPWANARQTPLSHSFCQHVVAEQKPLIVSDARTVSFLKDNLAIPDLSVIGYLGMPLTTSDGVTLGSFCVIDSKPRDWTAEEVQILEDLAETTMALVEMRSQIMTLTTLNENRIRSAMAQLMQAESRRKHEAEFYGNLLRRVTEMVETHQPTADILAAMGEANTGPQH
jgi:GAF domain-containing protein